MDETVRSYSARSDAAHPINIYGVQDFISRFAGHGSYPGFFFTTNQDLFVERHHYNGTIPNLPGIKRDPNWFTTHFVNAKLNREDRVFLPAENELSNSADLVKGHSFLYVKLHGSSNWCSSDGSQRMVIGYGKAKQIFQEPLLSRYFQIFESVLLSEKRRLLVVGYGFRDTHINEVIAKAVKAGNVELYILSPQAPASLKECMSNLPHGKDIWAGLCGYFPFRFLDVFPADQSKSPAWNVVSRNYFGS